MRNGLNQQSQQMPLNQSINAVKGIMAQIKGSQDPQGMLAQILQNNSNTATIANMLQSGGSLEQIARQMAQQRGIDINQLINQLNS